MKKHLSILLILVLMMNIFAAVAIGEEATPEETPIEATETATDAPAEEVEEAVPTVMDVMEMFRLQHMAQHDLETIYGMQEATLGQIFEFPKDEMSTMLSCVELTVPEVRTMPKKVDGINELFQELFLNSQDVTMGIPYANTVDLYRYFYEFNDNITMIVPQSSWWVTVQTEEYNLMAGPIMLEDEFGNVIDDTVYLFSAFFYLESTRLALYADQDVVRDFIVAFELTDQGSDKSKSGTYLREWLVTMEDYEAPVFREADWGFYFVDSPTPKPTFVPPTPGPTEEAAPGEEPAAEAASTAAPQSADGEKKVIGTVTVTSANSVNLRSAPDKESEVIGNAKSGAVLRCLSAQDGWYEVVYRDTTAFVSAALVSFESF